MAPPKIKGGRVGSVKKLKSSLKGGGGTNWIKRIPAAGDSIIVRVLTEPEDWIEYREYYSDEDKYFPEVEGMDPSYVEGLNSPAKRFLMAAIDTSENKVISLVVPTSVAKLLTKFYEKYSTLQDRDYELSKEGSGLDTEYSVLPEGASKINLRRFEKDIPDLAAVLNSTIPAALGGVDPDDDDDDDEDDDDEPIRKSRKRRRPASRQSIADDDDDDDDDSDPDDDEDDERPIRRRPRPRPSSGTKKPLGSSGNGLKKKPRPTGLKRR